MWHRSISLMVVLALLCLAGCAAEDDAGTAGTTTPTTEPTTTTIEAAPTTDSAPSTTEAAPTTTPPSTLDVESLSWERVPHDEAAFHPTDDARMKDVIAWDSGFVAVGETNTRYANDWGGDGAVWVSPDGVTWTLLPNGDRPLGGPQGQYIEAITAGGPGLVAVGLTFDDPDAAVGLAAAVWTSSDGVSWSSVAYDETAFGSLFHDDPGESATWLKDVTAGGPGLVAVGTDAWRGAVWTSPDGVNWTRVPHDPEVFGEGASWESHVELGNVTNAGPLLIATGFDDGYTSSALWTSRDGTTWSRVEVDGARYINDVTEGGPGFVAVGGYEDEPTGCHEGSSGECYAAVWTSTDGVDWTQVPHDTVLFGGGDDKQMMHAVTRVGSDLVAIGTRIWVSDDGITWTVAYDDPRIVGAEQNGMYDIAVGPRSLIATDPYDPSGEAANENTIVIVGDGGASEPSVVVWVGTAQQPNR